VGTGTFARPAQRSEAELGGNLMSNKSNHAGIGLALGAALGAVLGIAAGHIGAWLAIGVAIGMLLGASFRRRQPTCPECAQIHRIHEMKDPSNKLAVRS
jgi:hypothetical protein